MSESLQKSFYPSISNTKITHLLFGKSISTVSINSPIKENKKYTNINPFSSITSKISKKSNANSWDQKLKKINKNHTPNLITPIHNTTFMTRPIPPKKKKKINTLKTKKIIKSPCKCKSKNFKRKSFSFKPKSN